MRVVGSVYSLDLRMAKTVEANNVRISRVQDFDDAWGRIGRTRLHFKTADLLVETPEELKQPSEAIAYAEAELQDYAMLLSFAQGHDIPMGDLECGGTAKSITGRVGRAEGAWIVRSDGLADYLKTTIPLVRSKEFVENTGIVRAIQFYNGAANTEYSIVEIQDPVFFGGLEILANAHFETNPKAFLLGEAEWKELIGKIAQVLDGASTYLPAKNRVLGALGLAKAPISEKIEHLCQALALGDYSEDIARIVAMRNDILHGRPLKASYDGESPADVLMRTRRLLEKQILKALRFYDHPSVHSAFRAIDLRATS